MKIYVCGPMTGLSEFNFPAFNEAAKRLRGLGHEVINPAENDNGDTTKPWAYYMRQDIANVLSVDALAVLPGWQKSRGATLEVTVARALDVSILDAATLEPFSETVLEEAQRIVFGDRQASYGHPIEDFSRTARLWTARFWDKLKDPEGDPFRADEVPAAMRLVKESRLTKSPRHRDSLVDISGYVGTQALVWERDVQ